MYGIPQEELAIQAHEALRTDGWLDPDEAKNIAGQLSAAQLVSSKYKESADHYVNKVGELEQEIRRLNARAEEWKAKYMSAIGADAQGTIAAMDSSSPIDSRSNKQES